MKLLFTSNFYPPETQGGYELRLYHLVQELSKEHSCVVVTSGNGTTEPSGNHQKIYRCFTPPDFRRNQKLPSKIKSVFQSQREVIKFAQILETEKPDWVCHFNLAGLTPALASVSNLLNLPQCFWYEDTWSSGIPLGKSGVLDPWFQVHQKAPEGGFRKLAPLIRNLLPVSDRISKHLNLPAGVTARHKIAVSYFQEWKNREDFITADQSWILPTGIPFNTATPFKRDAAPSQPIKLLMAGALTPDRGFDVLFEALGSMDETSRKKFILTLVGKAPNDWAMAWWKDFQSRHQGDATWERINHIGWLEPEQIKDVLKKHDVLIFPSRRGEGMPLIIQEAMVYGCLVLSSGSGGAGELCHDAGIPIFPANNPHTLREQLLALLSPEMDWKTQRECLQNYAFKHFSIEQMARSFLDTLLKK